MDVVRTSELTDEQVFTLMWERGDLSPLMHSGARGQLQLRNAIHEWRMVDQMAVSHADGSLPLLFAVPASKRWGKTSAFLWIQYEIAHWFVRTYKRRCELRFTSAFQKSIDEIIGKVVPQCFETAPAGCEPEYFGKRGTRPAGLYFPEQGPLMGSYIALAGLDLNPNALRGQSSDGDVISEAGFIGNLEYVVRNVLTHQYQGKPHARMCAETSAPEDIDTDWELTILPDAVARGAVFEATIEDNPRLTRRAKDFWIGQAGGLDSPDCQREYFNKIIGNPQLLCVPEFVSSPPVRDVERPKHAMALAADDPGYRHLYGKVWGYYHFDLQALVIEDSWGQTNASTVRSATVSAAREFDLYGRLPSPLLSVVPLQNDGRRDGWVELLKGDRCEHLAEELWSISQMAPEDRPDREYRPGLFVRQDRPGEWTYYDDQRSEYMPNPHARVADVDLRLIADLAEQYGLDFEPTTKVELRTMVANARRWIMSGRVIFLPTAGPVIQHTRAAKWDKGRAHLAEHKVLGHFDVFSALVYLIRYAELIEPRNPYPPHGLEMLKAYPGDYTVDRLPWQEERPYEAEVRRRVEAAEAEAKANRGASGRIKPAARMRTR